MISYTTAISACGSGGTADEAVAIFREMEGAGVPPNIITHNAVVAACVAAGEWERALEIFEEVFDADSVGLTLKDGDAFSFNTALSACEVSRATREPRRGGRVSYHKTFCLSGKAGGRAGGCRTKFCLLVGVCVEVS